MKKATKTKRSKTKSVFILVPKDQTEGIPEKVTKEEEGAAKTSAAGGNKVEIAFHVEAKIDVGVGNALFIRGQGAGLNWERGQPLTCVDASRWVWHQQANEKMQFKLLLNDQIWAQGEDIVAEPFSRVEVVPQFCQ